MRYFFHVHDGIDYLDDDGVECATLDIARTEAVRASAGILNDKSKDFWAGDVWTMRVKDEVGVIVFELVFSAR